MQNDEILEEIDKIIASLQRVKWSEHSPAMLLSAQGKLASYQVNVIRMANDAQYAYDLAEINMKNAEADKFLDYREMKMSIEDAKTNTRRDCAGYHLEVIKFQREWNNLRGIVEAIKTITVAISTTIKFAEQERFTAGKV